MGSLRLPTENRGQIPVVALRATTGKAPIPVVALRATTENRGQPFIRVYSTFAIEFSSSGARSDRNFIRVYSTFAIENQGTWARCNGVTSGDPRGQMSRRDIRGPARGLLEDLKPLRRLSERTSRAFEAA